MAKKLQNNRTLVIFPWDIERENWPEMGCDSAPTKKQPSRGVLKICIKFTGEHSHRRHCKDTRTTFTEAVNSFKRQSCHGFYMMETLAFNELMSHKTLNANLVIVRVISLFQVPITNRNSMSFDVIPVL